MLNRYDRASPMSGEAEVKYLDGDFRVVRPGAFVRCAVTGVPIPLEELKYWSVDLQEAYATPEAVLQRHRERIRPVDNRLAPQFCRYEPPQCVGFIDHHRHGQFVRAGGEPFERWLTGDSRAVLLRGQQY